MIDKILRKIEAEIEHENKYWICGPDTGKFLYDMVCTKKPKTLLEIGTSVGYSALWMAKAVSSMQYAVCSGGAKIYTIESHKKRGELALKNFSDAGVNNLIVLVKGHAPEIISDIPGNFDFVFFDATKYEHPSYFEAVFPRMNHGAFLVSDNIFTHGEGEMMRRFLSMVRNNPALKSEIVKIGNGLLVAIRKGISAR